MAAGRGHGGVVALLALAAVLLFVAGEALLFFRSGRGSFFLAERGMPFSRPAVATSLSQEVQATLRRLGVGPGQTGVDTLDTPEGRLVRWSVRLSPRASLFLVNAAVTEAFERRGGRVFDGWEEPSTEGGERVTLRLGVRDVLTHQVTLLRSGGPVPDEAEAVRLAIVIEGFGPPERDSLGQAALRAPFTFTAAVLSNARRSRSWADALTQRGREVVAHVPMEPLDYPKRSPGPDAILVDMSRDRIRRLVRKHVRAVPGAIAYLPYMGGMALQETDVLNAVAGELRQARLAYIEVAGDAPSVGLDAAAAAGVPFLRLDGRFEPGRGSAARRLRNARNQLQEFTDTARRRGFASFAVRLEPGALAALEREVPRLESQGVHVVPLSSLLRPSVY